MDGELLAAAMPEGFELPAEFRELCKWVARHGYPISGYFELRTHSDDTIRDWFGSQKPLGHLAQFGAGSDGSLYCLWRCEDDRMPIVHLGSEGDHCIVLASTPLDFLRLLAIGYDEIGFADLTAPPSVQDAGETVNPEFQKWVETRFLTTIPSTGVEIVDPAQARERNFQKWIQEQYEF